MDAATNHVLDSTNSRIEIVLDDICWYAAGGTPATTWDTRDLSSYVTTSFVVYMAPEWSTLTQSEELFVHEMRFHTPKGVLVWHIEFDTSWECGSYCRKFDPCGLSSIAKPCQCLDGQEYKASIVEIHQDGPASTNNKYFLPYRVEVDITWDI